MKTPLNLWRRFRSLGQKRAVKQEIDEELRFHIEQRTDEYIAGGMSPEEAARAARRRFGNVQSVREECREAHGANCGETILQDIRFGLRMLGKHPGFTILAALSLAIGIGVNTTIFSALDAAYLRPLPVKNYDEIVRFNQPAWVTLAEYREMRSDVRSLSDLVAVSHHEINVPEKDGTIGITTDYVSRNYFTALGVKPALGRLFSETDEAVGTSPVVVISYGLWQRRFAGDPKIVGQKFVGATVLGVAAKDFGDMDRNPRELWIPFGTEIQKVGDLELIGRLGAGCGAPQVQAEAEALVERMGWDLPKNESGKRAMVTTQKERDARVREPALLVMPLVGLVLLVACANVSSLLLARYEERRRELALRVALGGGRLRLLRQLLVEGLLLSVLGAAAGLLLTAWALHVVPLALPELVHSELRLDGRVLGWAMGLACVATFVFALLPAWRATRVDLAPLLKGESAPSSARLRWWTGRNALVVGQLAASLVFLATTTLVLRGYINGMGSDFGFDPRNLIEFVLYPSSRSQANFDRLQERVRALPGVKAVSLAMRVPFAPFGGGASIRVLPPQRDAEVSHLLYSSVDPGYFDTLGIRLLRGRVFQDQDNSGAPRVIIVSEAAARKYWPGEDPLGKTLQAGFDKLEPRQVVGVVRDADNYEVRQTPEPFIYLPFRQERGFADINLVVRTDGRFTGMDKTVRHAMLEVDKKLVVALTSHMEDTVRYALMPQWVGAWLGGVLGLLAFLLAVSGLYGVVAHAVSRRTREMGIRMALGARRADVLWMVLRQGLALASAGVALGLPAALCVGFLVRHRLALMGTQLFGVSPADPLALVGASVVVAAVALLASFVPARRAAKINPVQALRYE